MEGSAHADNLHDLADDGINPVYITIDGDAPAAKISKVGPAFMPYILKQVEIWSGITDPYPTLTHSLVTFKHRATQLLRRSRR